MPVEYFIRYKGECYDVGTKLKFKHYSYGIYLGIVEGTIEKFVNHWVYIRGDDGTLYTLSTNRDSTYFDKEIIEIIEPVYYTLENLPTNNRECPPEWDVEIGWIWYIIIMVVGTIFKDRLLIWVFATAIFFLWKNGFLNGGKK